MKIRTVLLSLAIAFAVVSCKTESKQEQLQKELDTKKLEYSNLKVEINTIQEELFDLDTTANKVREIAVKIEKVENEHFEHFFHMNGSFEAVEYAFISSETSGRIDAILVKEGEKVKKGQLLAKLNTEVIENTIREVKTALSLSSIVYKKQKELWDKNIGSELDYLRSKAEMEGTENKLATLQSQLDMSLIKSPINGIVDQIIPKVGELAGPGQFMMQIINLDDFYLNTEVSESYLPFLKKGDEVSIDLLSYEDKIIEDKIYRISKYINPENRSFKVQIKVKNSEGLLRPNMLAKAKFKDYENKEALIVPSIIIKTDFNGEYLFLIEKQNNQHIAKKVYIETGKNQGEKTMVKSGLNQGDKVIVSGYNLVVNGSVVSVK